MTATTTTTTSTTAPAATTSSVGAQLIAVATNPVIDNTIKALITSATTSGVKTSEFGLSAATAIAIIGTTLVATFYHGNSTVVNGSILGGFALAINAGLYAWSRYGLKQSNVSVASTIAQGGTILQAAQAVTNPTGVQITNTEIAAVTAAGSVIDGLVNKAPAVVAATTGVPVVTTSAPASDGSSLTTITHPTGATTTLVNAANGAATGTYTTPAPTA